MDDILDDLGDPVCSKGNEDDKSNNFAFTASSSIDTASFASRLIFSVNSHECDGEPSPKSSCCKSSDQRDNEDMVVFLGHIDNCLEYKDRERNSGDPANKANDVEYPKDQIDDRSAVVTSNKVNNSGSDTEDNLKDCRDPNSPFSRQSAPSV